MSYFSFLCEHVTSRTDIQKDLSKTERWTAEGRVTVTKELRTNWFGPHFEKWALISHDCYTVQFVNTFWKCELILEAKMQFVNTFLLLQKWVQNEEQFTALFALISKLGKCIHKTVFTKLYSQKWAATVTRPSVNIETNQPKGHKADCLRYGPSDKGSDIHPMQHFSLQFC